MAIPLSQFQPPSLNPNTTTRTGPTNVQICCRPPHGWIVRSSSGGGGGGGDVKKKNDGVIFQTVQPKDAAAAIGGGGFRLLDVRPTWERSRAFVAGSSHVPLYVEDGDSSPITLLKKMVHFGYIGLWTGQLLTTINGDFCSQVEEVFPEKEAKLLVACGEGLRSLVAVRKLHEKGYCNVSWLAGGFNRLPDDDDLPVVEVSSKLRYATVGGVSYYFLQLLLLLKATG